MHPKDITGWESYTVCIVQLTGQVYIYRISILFRSYYVSINPPFSEKICFDQEVQLPTEEDHNIVNRSGPEEGEEPKNLLCRTRYQYQMLKKQH